MENNFVALLSAQAPIVSILTGGIYSYEALGLRGLVPNNPLAASAFQSIGGLNVIRPSLVVRFSLDTATNARIDKPTNASSSDGVLNLWFYQYEFYDQINLAADLIFDFLKYKSFANIGHVLPLLQRRGQIAPEYDDVSLRIDDYTIKRVKRT